MTLPTSIVSGKVWSEQWLFLESIINKGVSTSVRGGGGGDMGGGESLVHKLSFLIYLR